MRSDSSRTFATISVSKEKVKLKCGTRRTVFILVAFLAAIFLSSHLAFAATNRDANDSDELKDTAAGDVIRGGFGPDTIEGTVGADNIDGGLGPDELNGGDGADAIVEGPQRDVSADTIRGGDGHDFIDASTLPYFKDSIDCGGGNDSIEVDPSDHVASNCETVEVQGDAKFERLERESLDAGTTITRTQPVQSGTRATAAGCSVSQTAGRPYYYMRKIWSRYSLTVSRGCGRRGYTYSIYNTSGFWRGIIDQGSAYHSACCGYTTYGTEAGKPEWGREQYRGRWLSPFDYWGPAAWIYY